MGYNDHRLDGWSIAELVVASKMEGRLVERLSNKHNFVKNALFF